jgi:serine/threonine-protein kinase RsbW
MRRGTHEEEVGHSVIRIEHESGSSSCVARVSGDLDCTTVPELREGIDTAVSDGCTKVVLDLSDVTYLDSSALGFLVWADRRLMPVSGRLMLAGAGSDVLRVLELSGLIGVAPCVMAAASVDEALFGLALGSATAVPLWVEEFSFPADVSQMAPVRARITEIVAPLGLSESAVFDIKVAVGEALANAIRHGSPRGPIDYVHVEVRAFGDRVDVVVSDAGPGFDGVSPARQDVYAPSGRGVLFMRALMDAVEFAESVGGGTSVRLAKRVSVAQEPGV